MLFGINRDGWEIVESIEPKLELYVRLRYLLNIPS